MRGFVILTSRKRVIVALAHTVAFLIVAVLLSHTIVRPLGASSSPGSWAVAGIYLVVTTVLLILLAYAGRMERIYFGLCASSAGSGLLRQVIGDPRMHAAVYLRVLLLACAVVAGSGLLRRHPGEERIREDAEQ